MRRYLAQFVLVAAALGGVQWIYPRISRVTAHFEVAAVRCAEAVAIEVWDNGEKVKSLRAMPATVGPAAVYTTALHRGAYDVVVRLDCTSGEVIDGKPRPIILKDDTTIHLRASGRCVCD